MSTFNSLCIIMVIYGSLISAAPSIFDSIESDIEHRIEHVADKIVTGTEATIQKCAKCSQTQNDHPCPLETYKLLLQSFISNSDLLKPKTKIRDDYQYTPNVGVHKFHTRSANWNVARTICREEGGHLAIINSRDEAHVLWEMFNQTRNIKGANESNVAYIGIHDQFVEGEWITVLDDSLSATGFTKWSDRWGGEPDNIDTENCGVFVTYDESLGDICCKTLLPFFCELPMDEHMQ